MVKLKHNWVVINTVSIKLTLSIYLSTNYKKVNQLFLKLCQDESYHQEIEILQKHCTIHRSSQIIALDPIFKDNLLHVGENLPI